MIKYLACIYLAAFLLAGGYYEWGTAVLTVLLGGWLAVFARKNKVKLRVNDTTIAIFALSVFYILSPLWAVDSGMAFWGAVKYFPVLLFGLCLLQLTPVQRRSILNLTPELGAFMTVSSYLLSLIPAFRSSFIVSERLGGFFQYPNTYTEFLLIGVIVLLFREETSDTVFSPFHTEKPGKLTLYRMVILTLLLFGCFQAQSRAVLALLAVAFLFCLIKKRKRVLLFSVLFSVPAALLLSVITSFSSKVGTLDHVVNALGGQSTFWARLLYFRDALGEIAKHPLGLGYLGYYFTQGSFQTGAYHVRWVHNDFLQLALNIGWIPLGLLLFAMARSLLRKREALTEKTVLFFLAAHMMFDFDMEFLGMWFVLLLCLDWDEFTEQRIAVSGWLRKISMTGMVLTASVSVYIGIVAALTYSHHAGVAAKLYPGNTLAQTELLSQELNERTQEGQMLAAEDLMTYENIADDVLARNPFISQAWDLKAAIAYTSGDFGNVIQYKRKAIECNRFDSAEYQTYFDMLKVGAELYDRMGDTESAALCRKEMSMYSLPEGFEE